MLTELLKYIGQLFSWFVVIAPWEQAIRVRLGKHTKLLSAGWYIKIPFADKIYKQSVRRRLRQIRPQTLTSLDRHVITCSGAVGYYVKDLEKLYDTLESPNDTIENEIAAIISQFVGGRNLKECSSKELELFVKERMDLSRYGLSGDEFYLTSFSTCKTYRFITGEMGSWHHDSGMSMAPEGDSRSSIF